MILVKFSLPPGSSSREELNRSKNIWAKKFNPTVRWLNNLCKTDKEGYKAVNYIGLIPVLTEGIKAQQELIEQQGQQITAQQEEMAILKNRLAKIEAALNIRE